MAHGESQRFGQQLPHAKQVGVHEHSSALWRSVLCMHVSVNGNAIERLYRGLTVHWLAPFAYVVLGAGLAPNTAGLASYAGAEELYVVCNARFCRRRRVQSP